MTSDFRLAAVGLKVTSESNPSPEGSRTHGTWVCGYCSLWRWRLLRLCARPFPLCFSGPSVFCRRATVVTLLRQVRLSEASDSQVLGLMFTSLWDSLRQSLKRFFCQDGCYELAGTAKLPIYLPQTVFAYRIESLGQVNKGHKRSLFCSWNFSLTDEVET